MALPKKKPNPAQKAKRIDPVSGSVPKYGTPEYAKAWREGKIQLKSADGEKVPYWGGQLDEVIIKRNKKEKNWLEEYADKIVEENKDGGLINAIVGVPISAVTSLPQLMATKAFSGKMQRPSEAIGFEETGGWLDNPKSFGKNLVNFGIDAITDPADWIGVGEISQASRLSKGSLLSKVAKMSTSITPELAENLSTQGLSLSKLKKGLEAKNTKEASESFVKAFFTPEEKVAKMTKENSVLKHINKRIKELPYGEEVMNVNSPGLQGVVDVRGYKTFLEEAVLEDLYYSLKKKGKKVNQSKNAFVEGLDENIVDRDFEGLFGKDMPSVQKSFNDMALKGEGKIVKDFINQQLTQVRGVHRVDPKIKPEEFFTKFDAGSGAKQIGKGSYWSNSGGVLREYSQGGLQGTSKIKADIKSEGLDAIDELNSLSRTAGKFVSPRDLKKLKRKGYDIESFKSPHEISVRYSGLPPESLKDLGVKWKEGVYGEKYSKNKAERAIIDTEFEKLDIEDVSNLDYDALSKLSDSKEVKTFLSNHENLPLNKKNKEFAKPSKSLTILEKDQKYYEKMFELQQRKRGELEEFLKKKQKANKVVGIGAGVGIMTGGVTIAKQQQSKNKNNNWLDNLE
jgi:hypothetical protein